MPWSAANAMSHAGRCFLLHFLQPWIKVTSLWNLCRSMAFGRKLYKNLCDSTSPPHPNRSVLSIFGRGLVCRPLQFWTRPANKKLEPGEAYVRRIKIAVEITSRTTRSLRVYFPIAPQTDQITQFRIFPTSFLRSISSGKRRTLIIKIQSESFRK